MHKFNLIIFWILKLLAELKATGTFVCMILIKGHSGFPGNEMADFYAKMAVEEGIETNITTRRDLKNKATNILKIDWNREWTDTEKKRKNIHPGSTVNTTTTMVPDNRKQYDIDYHTLKNTIWTQLLTRSPPQNTLHGILQPIHLPQLLTKPHTNIIAKHMLQYINISNIKL